MEAAAGPSSIAAMLAGLCSALMAEVWLVRIGVEAAEHYRQPDDPPGVWPEGGQVVELNLHTSQPSAESTAAVQ